MKIYVQKLNNLLKNNIWLIFLIIPLFLVTGEIDNDFWFMANHGRYILKNGFATIEPFTVHEEFVFSFEKWLSCTTFYGVYSIFGPTGLYIFKLSLAALILLLLYLNLKYITKRKGLSSLITVLTGIFFALFYFKTRPQLFSYLILLSEFYLLEHWSQEGDSEYLWFIPILSCLYIQLHSTMWPIFFIVIMPYLFDFNFIANKLKLQCVTGKKKNLILITLLSFLVGFCNPYGYKSVFYLFNSFNVFNLEIKELASPTLVTFISVTFPVLGFVALGCSNLISKKVQISSIPLRAIYFFLGTLAMSLMAIRNLAYFLLFGTLACSYFFPKTSKTLDKRDKFVTAILAASTFLAGTIILPGNNINYYEKTDSYEILNQFAEQTRKDGFEPKDIKLFTEFNNGSYAEWLGFKCYIDPRAEVFSEVINKKEDIISEYIKLDKKEISYKDIQNKYNFDYWLIYNSGAVYEGLKNDEEFEEYITTKEYTVFRFIDSRE